MRDLDDASRFSLIVMVGMKTVGMSLWEPSCFPRREVFSSRGCGLAWGRTLGRRSGGALLVDGRSVRGPWVLAPH